MDPILSSLLNKLRESQSWCPMCGGEYVCDPNCGLYGIWHEDEDLEDSIAPERFEPIQDEEEE